MLPGPKTVYKCPTCGNLLTRGSLLSGNTIGLKSYSDGKKIAPMLPEFPSITKCKKCNTIFWLSKAEIAETFIRNDEDKSKWDKAEEAEFLDVYDFFEALVLNLHENKNDELWIRLRIWWAFNDRIRHYNELFINDGDEVLWSQNCNTLIELLDINIESQKIIIAELNRNLGNFEECIKLIESLKSSEMESLYKILKTECEEKNQIVVQLDNWDYCRNPEIDSNDVDDIQFNVKLIKNKRTNLFKKLLGYFTIRK